MKRSTVLSAIAILTLASIAPAQKAPARITTAPTLPERQKLLHFFASDGTVADVMVTGNPERHVTLFRSPHGSKLRIERVQSKLGGVKTTVQLVGGETKVELVEYMLFHEQHLKAVPRAVNVNGNYVAGLDDGSSEMRAFLGKAAAEFNKTSKTFQTAVLDYYRYTANLDPRDVQVPDSPDPLAVLMTAAVQLNADALLPLIMDADGHPPKALSSVIQVEPNSEVADNLLREFSH